MFFSGHLQIENPVLSEDYLQAHNADILAGPIELASCMDLNEDGGLVTLTSPKLFRTKSRNLLVHIKTMADVSKNGHGKTRGKAHIYTILHCVIVTRLHFHCVCSVYNVELICAGQSMSVVKC